jgi:hypothetical protein
LQENWFQNIRIFFELVDEINSNTLVTFGVEPQLFLFVEELLFGVMSFEHLVFDAFIVSFVLDISYRLCHVCVCHFLSKLLA